MEQISGSQQHEARAGGSLCKVVNLGPGRDFKPNMMQITWVYSKSTAKTVCFFFTENLLALSFEKPLCFVAFRQLSCKNPDISNTVMVLQYLVGLNGHYHSCWEPRIHNKLIFFLSFFMLNAAEKHIRGECVVIQWQMRVRHLGKLDLHNHRADDWCSGSQQLRAVFGVQ